MRINHDPLIKNTDQVFEMFGIEEGAKYVCTSALNDSSVAWDIYYTKEKNPEHGNHYFGVKINNDDSYSITNTDTVEQLSFGMFEHGGVFYYSRYEYDYVGAGGKYIDSGRSEYLWTNAIIKGFKVVNGEFVELDK